MAPGPTSVAKLGHPQTSKVKTFIGRCDTQHNDSQYNNNLHNDNYAVVSPWQAFQSSLVFVGLGAYPIVENLEHLKPAGLSGTNSLAYYGHT